MESAAARGAEPTPVETAELAAELTDISAVAEQAGLELPRSSAWQAITAGIRAAARGLLKVLAALSEMRITGISVNAGVGLPFGMAKVEITFDLSPRAPPQSAGTSDGATPGP
jgi:hypothetical protein